MPGLRDWNWWSSVWWSSHQWTESWSPLHDNPLPGEECPSVRSHLCADDAHLYRSAELQICTCKLMNAQHLPLSTVHVPRTELWMVLRWLPAWTRLPASPWRALPSWIVSFLSSLLPIHPTSPLCPAGMQNRIRPSLSISPAPLLIWTTATASPGRFFVHLQPLSHRIRAVFMRHRRHHHSPCLNALHGSHDELNCGPKKDTFTSRTCDYELLQKKGFCKCT